MKKGFLLFGLTLVMAAICGIAGLANAATADPSPASPGYATMVIPFFGNHTSNRTGKLSFKTPVGYVVKSASAIARTASGTSPTLKIRGKNGALVNYSGTVATGATATDLKVPTGAKMTDETLQSIDLVIGGTSPIWSDITLTLFLKRL